MKEFCGYKGLNGELYEKQSDCEKADLDYKIRNISRKLDNFSSSLSEYLYRYKTNGLSYYDDSYLLDLVAKAVLRDSAMFIEVIKEAEGLKAELEQLYKEKSSLSKWWLKFKWW